MATKTPKRAVPLPTDEEAAARYKVMDAVIRQDRDFYIDELEAALGMYMLAHHFGWRVLYFVHSKKTIRKYEDLLGLKLSEHFEEYGPAAERTNAFKLIQTVSNFWKAISGEEKPALDLDKRVVHRK